MKRCDQMVGLSVYQHGEMVHRYFLDIYNHIIRGDELCYEWKLPQWLIDNSEYIMSNLVSLDNMKLYHVYHDCGKPYCKVLDADGKVHFPDHAQISFDTWMNSGGNPEVGQLILHDMDIHLLKAVGIPQFMLHPNWVTLLLTGLCELHANATMFGGVNSTGFKIKWKNINKRGNGICKLLLQG